MKSKDLTKILIVGGLIFLVCSNLAQAGFGISPARVQNQNLLPGSHFEQTIYLVQSNPEKDLLANIEIDAPEIGDWISIDRGLEFDIPAGSRQFPIKVIVDVPIDAEFENYDGKIWVKTLPKTEEGEGMVTIALGAVIAVDLRVSAEEVFGFVVRGITIKDTEEGRAIKVAVKIQNVGNVENTLSKVHLDIYDAYLENILQSADVNKLKPIKAFETKEIIVKFSNKLSIGSYFGVVEVYKDDKSLGGAKIPFYVIERTGFLYKIFIHWYSWIILIILILIIVSLIFRRRLKNLIRNYKYKRIEKKKKRLEEKLKNLEK